MNSIVREIILGGRGEEGLCRLTIIDLFESIKNIPIPPVEMKDGPIRENVMRGFDEA